MRFAWNRATAEEAAAAPTDDAASTGIAPIELLLDDGSRQVGWVDTAGQRTSDWLNARPQVPVVGRTAADTAAPEAEGPPSTPAEPLDRNRIVWVVPPALPPNRHLRLHRRRVLVHFELDGYDVSGQAHVRPGADAIDQVLRGTRDLVPLTEVQVVAKDDPSGGASLSVIIVNRRHVRRVVEDTPHTSAAVPEPVITADWSHDPRIALLMPDAVDPEPAADTAAGDASPTTPEPPTEPSGIEMLTSALALLLEAGVIDVVEFQSIRARLPQPPG